MIPSLGFFFLTASLLLSCILIGLCAFSPSKKVVTLCTSLIGFCILTSFACLVTSYVTSDFSVLNVALNSHTQKPLLYKITGTWGNHEGSMLLWVTVLALFTTCFAWFSRAEMRLRHAVLLVQGVILLGFLSFILLTSNPFIRLFPVPENGNGLNPLLQDIGLALHPPLLYTGYVGFSLTFSAAIALLFYPGEQAVSWARVVKPWAMVSWGFLTLGIGMGSWWAYRELGWGGFWFWDPVENASLMPWLAGTAFVHSLLVLEKRDTLKRWCVLLALLTFSLSLLGTFLVRSGVLTSVHSFANDPGRGLFILALLAFFIISSLTLFAFRSPRLKATAAFGVVSRETSLFLNNLFILTACATVMLGTLYPLLLEVWNGSHLSIGAPYFNQVFNPLALPLLALAIIGPALHWKQDSLKALGKRLLLPALSLPIAYTIVTMSGKPTSWLGIAALAFSVWLVVGLGVLTASRIQLFRLPLTESAKRLFTLSRNFQSMALAHLGLAILVIGITGASEWQEEKQYVAKVGEEKAYAIGPYTATLHTLDYAEGANYLVRRAVFYINHGSDEVAHLAPETRYYPVEKSQTTEAAIYTSFLSDTYVAIGEMDKEGHIAIRLYYKPLINAIWLGCVLMAVGAFLAVTGKKQKEV